MLDIMANLVKCFPDLAALKKGVEELEEASRVKFVVLNKDKAFGHEYNFGAKTTFRLRWEYDEDQHPCRIPYSGVPFIAVGRKTLECHQGKDRNIRQKERYAIQAEKQRSANSKRKKQAVMQRTKKVCCPASIIIIQIARLIDIEVKDNKEWAKRTAAAEFRKMLSKSHVPRQKSEFYAVFPRDEDHRGHPIRNEAAGLREPTIPEVVEKVRALTREGVGKVSEMKQHIVHFLHKELHVTDTLRRRYMPTNSDISNIMASEKRKTHQDIDSTSEFIATMRKKHPSDLVLYRGSSPKHGLLFCYQTTWQSRLLNRYGNQFCLLDAAHRTLSSPTLLYLLFVRTNVAYVAVGAFIIQNEDMAQVGEALDIFAKWNPSWTPSHFLVDVSALDIEAVEACFKGCSVCISDFHRERAWSDLLSRHHQDQKRDTLLPLLRRIAHADSQERYDTLLPRLHDCTDMKENQNLSSVLTNSWLPEAKRWVRCFQDEAFYVTVHAAGGVDKQTEALKYHTMKSYMNSALKDLVCALIMNYFPESYRKYLERNARASPGYNQCNASIPQFLRNRPRAVVRHIQERLATDIQQDSMRDHGDGTFTVHTTSERLSLSFGAGGGGMPRCSCRDWQQHFLPCKHFCAVFRHWPAWQWERLSPVYRDSPIFSLDEAFLVADASLFQGGTAEEEVEEEEQDELEKEEEGVEPRGCDVTRVKGHSAERKRALQEFTEASQAVTLAIKKFKDTAQVIAMTKKLQDILDEAKAHLSFEQQGGCSQRSGRSRRNKDASTVLDAPCSDNHDMITVVTSESQSQ